MKRKFLLPEAVEYILNRLAECGFEGYIVGGSVRDLLCGETPNDFDFCTDATPVEIKKCFADHRMLDIGAKHGTVTLILENTNYEITTFRTEEGYRDRRRPDKVCFVRDISSDLARRDFTINAMAYNRLVGIIDLFGGEEDLRNRVIRTVGDANLRFEEDALRIMRALRFASALGFSIEEQTEKAIFDSRALLLDVSSERLRDELSKLLVGDGVVDILLRYSSVLEVFIPEISASIGFLQHSPHHRYDVYEHTARSIGTAPKQLEVRLTLLFHDLAKPQCFTTDEQGVGHFYNHQKIGSDIAIDALRRLRYKNETVSAVAELVRWHQSDIATTQKSVKRWLSKLGTDRFFQLIDVKIADNRALCAYDVTDRIDRFHAIGLMAKEIVEQNACLSIKDLAIDGNDLKSLGIPQGKEIGRALSVLLEKVLNETLPNEKHELIRYIKLHH